MIRISITPAAFEAIAATLLLGSVGYEPKLNAKGQRLMTQRALRSTQRFTMQILMRYEKDCIGP